MGTLSNPEVQKFIEQHTGTNPATMLQNLLPKNSGPQGSVVPSPGTPLTYLGGQAIYDQIGDKQFLKPFGALFSSLGQNHGRSAALTALALGLGGAGFGAMTGRDPLVSGMVGAGLGAGLGYGASALTGAMAKRRHARRVMNMANMLSDRESRDYRDANPYWMYEKQSSAYYGMGEGDPTQYITSRLFSDNSLSSADKTTVINAIATVPQSQLFSLASILRTVAGAGVGYIITRFLLNLGAVGNTIGAVTGGMMGSMLGSRLPRNAFGAPVDTGHDILGHSRYVF